MTERCAELNRKYGANGKIVWRDCRTGHPVARIENAFGVAEVSLYGAHVLSYAPAGKGETLFMSALTDFAPGTEIRGGIPVCWPWFGRNGAPGTQSHGFARQRAFDVRAARDDAEGTALELALVSDGTTEPEWPWAFELTLTARLGKELSLELMTMNWSEKPFLLTEGFHPYFLTDDARRCSVTGLDGCETVNAIDGSTFTQRGDFAITEPRDHVFRVKGATHTLVDPALDRRIAVTSAGNLKLVVWNPGTVKPSAIANLAPEDYRRFVCVEPATLFRDEALEIAPGATHALTAAIAVL